MAITVSKILLLRQMDIFKNVSDGALADLIGMAAEQNVKDNEALVDIKDKMLWYIILDGAVEIEYQDGSAKTISAFHSFGLPEMFCQQANVRVVATTKTIVLTVNKDTLYRLFVLHPSLFFACMESMSAKTDE